MACNDRQLSQAQREAGYTQQRTGVPFAVRPFSGSATIENLIDYLNRELVPGVRATRNAVNDVFLQVADQAPSANPLSYYFSTSVAASDPTVGRIKVNASPQNTSSVIRISQSNARLQDVTPWLDVMSGGPTTPLGTVTLLDSINPARFLRFDLNTMTDQGAYWDLGVSFIEGSHSDPFVEDEAVVLAFIAGVSAAGSTVPVGSISPIARDTFLGNIGTTTAAPAAVPLADVDSTSIVYDPTSHTFQRAALTGAISASQNGNATLFAGIRDNGAAENDRTNLNFLNSTSINLAVADDAGNDELEITAQRAALTGDVTAALNSNATTIANDAVTNAKLANVAVGTQKGLQIDAGASGDPVDLTGAEQGENIRFATGVTETATGDLGSTSYTIEEPVTYVIFENASLLTIHGVNLSGAGGGAAAAVNGRRVLLIARSTSAGVVLKHNSSTEGTAVRRFQCPDGQDFVLAANTCCEIWRSPTPNQTRVIATGNKGRLLRRTTYTSGSGTHTFLSDCLRARVRMKGGGGGGGGAGAPDGNVAGGGGEGAFEELDITSVPTSSAYAVGAAGTAGSSSSGTGGTGGDTTFHDGSVTRTAGGGAGGIAGGSIGEGGAGGTPDSIGGTVAYAVRGAPGGFGFLSSIPEGFGGNGGGSGAGKGGTNGGSSEAGTAAASNSGAGGGGGSRPNSPNVAGAAGGSGYIIVEEYT